MSNYVLLQRVNLTTAAASVAVSNLPSSGYSDLKVVASLRTDATNTGYDRRSLYLKLNENASNITAKLLTNDGTQSYTNGSVGWITAPDATAKTFASVEMVIGNYASTTLSKGVIVECIGTNNVTDGNKFSNTSAAYLWADTAPVHTFTFSTDSGNFVVGSSVSVYGLVSNPDAPVIYPKAIGGDIIRNDGTYWYHAFLSSGTFSTKTNLTCDALVIAGGGAGGVGAGSFGGGGGAGGYRTTLDTSPMSFAPDNYTITVGAGGTGVVTRTNQPTSGSNSSIAGNSITTYSATGGGYGGNESAYQVGANGGSSGGANYGATAFAGNAGGYTPAEGNAGANGYGPNNSGGGGGAGAAASNSNGGNGRNTNSNWASATGTGVSGYYAGGGASGTYSPAVAGTVGAGGGGASSVSGTPSPGTANTGSGGGASTQNGSIAGGNGGSGIVIIRYAMV